MSHQGRQLDIEPQRLLEGGNRAKHYIAIGNELDVHVDGRLPPALTLADALPVK